MTTLDSEHCALDSERCGVEHLPCSRPEPLSIVDESNSSIGPLLVVQVSRCCDDRDDGRGALFVEIIGDLDAYSAARVRGALAEQVVAELVVVIDTGGVSFIDSAGLRLLDDLQELSVSVNGRLYLHAPSRIIRRLIDIVGAELDICEPRTGHLRPLRYEAIGGPGGGEWT